MIEMLTDTDGGTSIARLYTLGISDIGRCESSHCAKYAEGYDGWARQMGEEPVVK